MVIATQETPIIERPKTVQEMSEETKKFCEEVSQVIWEVKKDVNTAPPEVAKPARISKNIIELQIQTELSTDIKPTPKKEELAVTVLNYPKEALWKELKKDQTLIKEPELMTPFMKAAKQYKKEERNDSFLNYLDNLGVNRNYALIRTASMVAAVKLLRNEEYLVKNIGQIRSDNTCSWTESDLNMLKGIDPLDDMDLGTEYEPNKQPPPHPRSCLIGPKQKHKPKRRSPRQRCTDLNAVISRTVHRRCYTKFLTCFYGLMFATVFAGLNVRFSCVN